MDTNIIQPEVTMMIFNNEQEVLEFASLSCLVDDDLEAFGVHVKTRQMTEEELKESDSEFDPEFPDDTLFIPIHRTTEPSLPVFDFLNEDFNSAKYNKQKYLLKHDASDLKVDPEYWKDFPCIAHMAFWDTGYGRSNRIYISPLSELLSMDKINQTIAENKVHWINELDARINRQRVKYDEK